MGGFGAALRSELYLAARNRWLRVLLLLPALAACVRVILGKVQAAGEQARGALTGRAPDLAADLDGYGAFADGLTAGFTFAYLALVTLAAHSIASDRDQGTVAQLLVRRVSRASYVLSKYVWLTILGLGMFLLVGAAAWGSAAILHDFAPVVEDGYELIGLEEIHEEIARGLYLALAPLPAAVGLGVLVSICARSPAGAVSAALGVTLGFDLFKGLLGDTSRYVYASYYPSLADGSYLGEVSRLVRGFSDVFVEEGVLRLNLLAPWPAALLFLAMALVVGRRREMC